MCNTSRLAHLNQRRSLPGPVSAFPRGCYYTPTTDPTLGFPRPRPAGHGVGVSFAHGLRFLSGGNWQLASCPKHRARAPVSRWTQTPWLRLWEEAWAARWPWGRGRGSGRPGHFCSHGQTHRPSPKVGSPVSWWDDRQKEPGESAGPSGQTRALGALPQGIVGPGTHRDWAPAHRLGSTAPLAAPHAADLHIPSE